jgi:AcrR family transcriptional regulator
VTRRGDATRQRILDAAELLYGDRGVDAVSLREIRLAAGQRNSSALQVHFGDADGVLLALAQRHMPRVGAIGERLRATLSAGGADDPAALVEVLVRPWAEYVLVGRRERAWVKVAADLAARPERRWREIQEHAPVVVLQVGLELTEALAPMLGPEVALDRVMRVGLTALHLCADRAARLDAPHLGGTLGLDDEAWADDLVATSVAAALAPPARRPSRSAR